MSLHYRRHCCFEISCNSYLKSLQDNEETVKWYICQKYCDLPKANKITCYCTPRYFLFRQAVCKLMTLHQYCRDRGHCFHKLVYLNTMLDFLVNTDDINYSSLTDYITDYVNRWFVKYGIHVSGMKRREIMQNVRTACQKLWLAGIIVYKKKSLVREVDSCHFAKNERLTV